MIHGIAGFFVLLCLAATGSSQIPNPMDLAGLYRMMDTVLNIPKSTASNGNPMNQTVTANTTNETGPSLHKPFQTSEQDLKEWMTGAKVNISVALNRGLSSLTKGIQDALTRAQGFWTSLPGYLQTIAPFLEIAILLFILLAVIVMARKVGNYMQMVRRVTRNASMRRQDIPMHRI